jgi:hypothetical protein
VPFLESFPETPERSRKNSDSAEQRVVFLHSIASDRYWSCTLVHKTRTERCNQDGRPHQFTGSSSQRPEKDKSV